MFVNHRLRHHRHTTRRAHRDNTRAAGPRTPQSTDTASDTLLIYSLSTLNFVAFFLFTFIFIRSLLKLRRERRAQQLGSKLKTRLIVYFIAVSLLPITAMAVFSYMFFNRTLDKWLSSLPVEVIREAREAHDGYEAQQADALRDMASGSTLTPKGWDTTDRYDVTAGARITALTVENA